MIHYSRTEIQLVLLYFFSFLSLCVNAFSDTTRTRQFVFDRELIAKAVLGIDMLLLLLRGVNFCVDL